jgi:hypothetical protein
MYPELGQTDEQKLQPRFRQKRPYKPVFHLPGAEWEVDALWDDAYYETAKRLIEGVACGEYLPAIEGVVGLYLFRHYLELALKFVIFHSRWLKDANSNARFEEIKDVQKTHSLGKLWDVAETECQRIIPKTEWNAIDVDFVRMCIKEFDSIDPDGERFRYHGDKFGVEKNPAKRADLGRTLSRYDLCIDFQELVSLIDHVRDVLHHLDTYMLETYGQNRESIALR